MYWGKVNVCGHVPFIAVEGPIGVGKTSLASCIATHYHYHLLEEIFEENPFLTRFYENIEEWSFQTEMFFLCTRYKQLEDIQRYCLNKNRAVVADYHIFKNLIFSRMTLNEHQYRKYQEIYRILIDDMPKPNIVIYLRASLDTLLKRIQLRGREMERNISPSYLQQLLTNYDCFIEEFQRIHPEVNVLSLDADNLDFVVRPDDLQYILSQLDDVLAAKFDLNQLCTGNR
jgi:deoxyguanosine kinase